MSWWFEASDHAVQIVLLAKCNHDRRQIILEKYEESASVPQGAPATQSASMQMPVLQQSITITQNTKTVPVSYTVTGSALTLSIRLLFLRDLVPPEEDVVFSTQDLHSYAAAVWRQIEE